MIIILDRDGVINHDSGYISSPEEWIPIPGSLEAIAELNRRKIPVVVASNQSGVARGFFTWETLEKINQKMHAALKKVGGHLDGVYYCPHHPDDGCECRKPKIGLLKKIEKDFSIPLEKSFFIGDTIKDIEAARLVKSTAILVLSGEGHKTLAQHSDKLEHVKIVENLAQAIKEFI